MIDTNGKFYLGKDPKDDQLVLYSPDDLTTHAVVVGMTGSGKTGLCIGLLEEAALQNIPAIMIDPKGDITNALLHFPDLLPSDFQPWVNPDEARRAGQTIEQAAEEVAASWREGLQEWQIGPERIQALKNAAHFAIYTPGSDAGIPISILASLKAPLIPWEGNQEILREKISGTVTALLGLVGMTDVDPVRSREHILLANIFEQSWSKNKDLDLGELIMQTQNPPFDKLGVMDLDVFFPEKDRFELSMLLNNILAAPAFQTWIQGEPLDIESLLWGEDDRPRHSVFFLAHLTDSERMFFITLLYSAIETWMRSQPGAATLRALVYFDEIFGYAPPISNPPTKALLLRMFKQARAFGVGQILVTQNPVDLDYKGLSNAGTWFIGKLQTEKDKERLLDGLQGASGGLLDRATYDQLISRLAKRQFLLHNVHEPEPQIFQTRWVMNYLAGPLTRTQIPALNRLAGAAVQSSEVSAGGGDDLEQAAGLDELQPIHAVPPVPAEKDIAMPAGTQTRAVLPAGVAEYFLPNNLTMVEAFQAVGKPVPAQALGQGLLYKPVLLVQADIRYLQRKYDLDHEEKRAVLVPDPDPRGVVRWENYQTHPVNPDQLARDAAPGARFGLLEAPFNDARTIKSLESDFVDWVYRRSSVTVFANESLKLYAGPETTEGGFRKQISDEARQALEEEMDTTRDKFQKKYDVLQKKLDREKRELEDDRTEHSQRKLEEFTTHFENLFGGKAYGRRRISSSLSKRRMTRKAKDDIEESEDMIEDLEGDIALLAKEMEEAIDELEAKWAEVARQVTEITVNPYKKDILVEIFGVAWMPYHLVEVAGQVVELPGFGAG
jgi:DNA helicase HerA-like ATPase